MSDTVQLDGSTIPTLTRGYRMQWEEAQQCYVLLYPEGMVKLNPSAAEILKRCDGERTLDEVIADLQHAFPETDLEGDVRKFLEVSYEQGWIRTKG